MTARQVTMVVLLGLALMTMWCVVRVSSAQRQLAATVARCATQRNDLAQCLAGGTQSSVHAEASMANDLVAQVQRTLVSAGVVPAAFRGIQPLSERVDPSAHVTERTVQLHLEGVRPSDLGAWLAAWCTPGQAWLVTELVWSHPPPATGNSIDNESGFVSVTLRSRSPL